MTEICESSFTFCEKLKQVEFSNKSKLKIIGKVALPFSLIKNIQIPSTVEKIYDISFL